jgi:hypothetical protein
MTQQPLVERITQLGRSVKRWRLVSLCLALLLICVVTIGGVFTAIPATREPGDFWLFLPWVRAARARAAIEEMRARENEVRALQAVEAAKRAEDEAAKKEP